MQDFSESISIVLTLQRIYIGVYVDTLRFGASTAAGLFRNHSVYPTENNTEGTGHVFIVQYFKITVTGRYTYSTNFIQYIFIQ